VTLRFVPIHQKGKPDPAGHVNLNQVAQLPLREMDARSPRELAGGNLSLSAAGVGADSTYMPDMSGMYSDIQGGQDRSSRSHRVSSVDRARVSERFPLTPL
jgi:hypothetical protein